jgi:hypothetical protein
LVSVHSGGGLQGAAAAARAPGAANVREQSKQSKAGAKGSKECLMMKSKEGPDRMGAALMEVQWVQARKRGRGPLANPRVSAGTGDRRRRPHMDGWCVRGVRGGGGGAAWVRRGSPAHPRGCGRGGGVGASVLT